MSILGERYFKTSNAIYSYGLGCRELAVYGYLRSRAGSKDYCWPSMQTIAAACGCSDTTARKAVDELERRGFIRRVATYATDRKGRRRQCNNTYYLLDLPPLPKSQDKLTYHEVSPENAGDEGTIGAPIEAQPLGGKAAPGLSGPEARPRRSGFDGERRSSGTSDFSPVRAEMSGVELATTKAG